MTVRAGLVLTSVLLAGAVCAQPVRPALRLPDAAEFPPQDQPILPMLRTGATVKLAATALDAAPDSVDTLRLAAEAGRSADVLRVLERIVQTAPARMGEAFQVLTRYHSTLFRAGDARGESDRLREIVAAAKRRLDELSREEAARDARQLMFFEPYDSRRANLRAVQLQAFVEAYAGTSAALEAEVDRIVAAPSSFQQLDELQAFAAAHPGTVVAAKATYERGFQLAVNIPITGVEKRGSDPTERFMAVLKIERELESGMYPRSEWVDRAPTIVTSFFASNPTYSPENLDRTIEASLAFALEHLTPGSGAPDGGHIGYFLTEHMPGLFKLKGDEVGGMDAMFTRLERQSDPSAAMYLRAQYYLRGMRETPADRVMFLRKALGALSQLQATGAGLYQRKALATLGTLRFNERDYAGARADLLKYVETYPDTDWAWVAAVRAGLAAIELGQPAQAVQELDRVAVKHGTLPVARALAHAYAARAEEAAGHFERALAHDREALRVWDDDYGASYTLYWHVTPRAEQSGIGSDAALVDKTRLAERVAALTTSLSRAQGSALERGRWLLAHDRRQEAVDTLRPLTGENSDVARDARGLVHRAQLDEALELTGAGRSGADERAALVQLERLAREPLDFAVVAARMAEACLLARQGDLSQAETRTAQALTDWYSQQRIVEPVSALERDVADIQRAVFLPNGGGVYGARIVDSSSLPPPFAIVNPAVRVKLAGGEITRLTLQQSLTVDRKVLFLSDDQLSLLRDMLAKLVGSKRGAPTAIMGPPNQPVGASMDILALWNKFFVARSGHGSWELESYPVVTQIEFTDAVRTKAAAAVTTGYSGVTVVLEKVDGRWLARRLTERWIE